ncbi:MAG: RHS repeat-associated core domain-containing protein [Acidobacteriota bacterium]
MASTGTALLLMTALLAPMTASAQTPAELEQSPLESLRGFRSNEPFLTADGVEAINTSNGNLNLSVPLGQEYSVGPLLKYRLAATYNSDNWNHVVLDCPTSQNCGTYKPVTFAVPNPQSNAGLGWEVHFGKLYAPDPPAQAEWYEKDAWPNPTDGQADQLSRWLYVSPSGASHHLYRLEGRPGIAGGVRYSKDGSQLRMVPISASTMEVQHPDGVVSVFRKTTAWAGTLLCGRAGMTCWRFHEMRDPYGNWVRVTYSGSGAVETWTITDRVGRLHTINFAIDDASVGRGDAIGNQVRTLEGDEIGDLRRVVTDVNLAAFGGQTATYNFHYDYPRISRGCPNNTDEDGNILGPDNHRIRVPMLSAIDFPEGQGFEFDSYTPSALGCSKLSGKVHTMITPSQGKTGYRYGNWSFPTRCSYLRPIPEPAVPEPFHQNRFGILSKIAYGEDGVTQEGRWEYRDYLVGSPQPAGLDCQRYDYRRTEVKEPVIDGRFTRQVFYNNLYEGPLDPVATTPIDQPQVTDSGLPFRKDARIGTSPDNYRFLSQETLACVPNGSCGKVRSKYVRYEMEFRQECERSRLLQEPASCYAANPVLAAERTVFHDDGGRYIERQTLEIDGVGNARVDIVRDNFEGVQHSIKTSTTHEVTGQRFTANPTTGYFDLGIPSTFMPGVSDRWILTDYSRQEVKARTNGVDGPAYVTLYQFNDQGSLTCTRRLLNPAGVGPKDLVTKLHVDPATGLVTRETVAGGDQGGLGTSLCSVNGSAAAGTRFETHHEHSHFALSESFVPGYPHSYEARIDRNTGLPNRLYDPTGQWVDLEFDRLGRVVEIEPSPNLRQAWTSVDYLNPAGQTASVEVQLRAPGSTAVLDEVTQDFDHRGRLVREILRRPTGSTSWGLSERRFEFDVLSRMTRETTLQASGAVDRDWATLYQDFDAFGRARRIVRPDLTVEDVEYRGVREVLRSYDVRTSETAFTRKTDSVVYNAQGQEIRSSNPLFRTASRYDMNGKRWEIRRTDLVSPGSPTQVRHFGWDNRGLLQWEDFPEVGTNGLNGRVTYVRDALGNPRSRHDGQHLLTYHYDTGGRLLETREGGLVITSQTWGTGTGLADLSRGKIKTAARYNYPPRDIEPFQFVETYTYGGRLGAMSHKRLQLRFPNRPTSDPTRFGATFDQTWSYDATGRRTGIGYPRCVTTPQTGQQYCNDAGDLQGPTHDVSLTYAAGEATAVSSTSGVSASYLYHPNLQLSQADYGNRSYTTFGQGTRGLVRADRIRTYQGDLQPGTSRSLLFDSGQFLYDGAGNPWAIGSDRYTYDLAGRLLSGTVLKAGPTRREDYTYDAFDNLLTVRRDSGALTRFNVDGNNRVRGFGGLIDSHYDGAGNLIQKGLGSPPAQEIEYDALNMQSAFRLTDSAGTHESIYLYGPGNYRVMVFEGDTGRRYWNLRDSNGKTLRRLSVVGWGPYQGPTSPGEQWVHEQDLVHGPDGLFATIGTGSVARYFHRDHLGSTRLNTNGVGLRTYEAAFYPYGDEIKLFGAGPGERDSKFTGHERDLHGRSDYMLGRYYHVPFKRFTSVDPARDGWNLYGYVKGNPVKYVDPDGRETSLAMALERDIRALQSGEITTQEYQNNIEARAAGGAAGLVVVVAGKVVAGAVAGSGIRAAVRGFRARIARAFSRGTKKTDVPKPSLNSEQAKNLARFNKKLPRGAEKTTVRDLPGGGKAFKAEVPGRVPGSKAVYEKQINAAGETVGFTKTTLDPAGKIVHIKDKLTGLVSQ